MEVPDKDLYGLNENSSSTHRRDKETVAFKFGEKEYNIYGEAIINNEEAALIYNKLLEESQQH